MDRGWAGLSRSAPDGPSPDGAYDLECHQRQAFWPQPIEAPHPRLDRRLYPHSGQRHHCTKEFDTTPQKYILGVTDEQYDAIVGNKFRTYVGSLLAATANPETGENPVFKKLPQGSLQPHVEKMRMTATQFAAATGLTVTDGA